MQDLWPDNIGEVKLRPPVTILREQAALLGQKTQNLVQAEIRVESGDGFFRYIFNIVAPALDNYRYELFRAWHKITLYPVEVYVEEEILEEIESSEAGDLVGEEERTRELIVIADSEEQFVVALRAIFGAGKTVQIINALLSQIDSGWPSVKEEDELPF
jgi:hypothetical protein